MIKSKWENKKTTQAFKDDSSKKIIVCYPIVTGNGAKHVATNLSHVYKEHYPEKRVALIDLDFHHDHMMDQQILGDNVHSIDNLLDKIDANQLTQDLFLENMITLKPQIDFLRGTQLKKDFVIICRHHIEEIFAHLRESYDKVFISVSNRHDNAGTIYGLNLADEVIMVARNNYTNFMKIDEAFEAIIRCYHKENTIKLVLNQYNPKSNINFGTWIMEHPVIALGMIPFDENAADGNDLTNTNLTRINKLRGGNKNQTAYEQILREIFISKEKTLNKEE